MSLSHLLHFITTFSIIFTQRNQDGDFVKYLGFLPKRHKPIIINTSTPIEMRKMGWLARAACWWQFHARFCKAGSFIRLWLKCRRSEIFMQLLKFQVNHFLWKRRKNDIRIPTEWKRVKKIFLWKNSKKPSTLHFLTMLGNFDPIFLVIFFSLLLKIKRWEGFFRVFSKKNFEQFLIPSFF